MKRLLEARVVDAPVTWRATRNEALVFKHPCYGRPSPLHCDLWNTQTCEKNRDLDPGAKQDRSGIRSRKLRKRLHVLTRLSWRKHSAKRRNFMQLVDWWKRRKCIVKSLTLNPLIVIVGTPSV